MITRIVKMTFKHTSITDFESLFEQFKLSIRSQEGCLHLSLLQDQNDPRIFFTYSIWENQKLLDQYRHSALFARVWPATKLLFEDKPEAWSTTEKVKLT